MRSRTASGREALLQVWVEPGNEDKTAHALRSLENSIVWDEQRFGLELDLDQYKIVAVGEYDGAIVDPKGLDITKLAQWFQAKRTVVGFPGAKQTLKNGADVLALPVDIIVRPRDH